MEWIKDNYVNVFAAIGACYTAARLIVALTPTKKDDAFVEKAGSFLTTIAKIFGLNISQGAKK
jgi:hypothetical protein